jgi:uncharacterized membrane protein
MIPAAVSSQVAGLWFGILLASILLGYGIVESFGSHSNPRCARGLMFVYVALLILILGIGFMKQFPGVPHIAGLVAIAALPAAVTGFALAVIGLRQQTQHRRFRRGTARGVAAVLLSIPAFLGLPELTLLKNEIVANSIQSGAVAATTPAPIPESKRAPVAEFSPVKMRAHEISDLPPPVKRPVAREESSPAPAPTPQPTAEPTPAPTPHNDSDGALVFPGQNFKITAPPNWTRLEAARLNPAAAAAFQCESPQALCMIVVEKPGVEANLNTSALTTLAKDHLKSTDKNAKFLGEKPEKINGTDFVEIESVVRINDLSLFYVHHLSFTNGAAYQLVTWGQDKDRDAIGIEAEKIAASFKLIDPELKFHKPPAPASIAPAPK